MSRFLKNLPISFFRTIVSSRPIFNRTNLYFSSVSSCGGKFLVPPPRLAINSIGREHARKIFYKSISSSGIGRRTSGKYDFNSYKYKLFSSKKNNKSNSGKNKQNKEKSNEAVVCEGKNMQIQCKINCEKILPQIKPKDKKEDLKGKTAEIKSSKCSNKAVKKSSSQFLEERKKKCQAFKKSSGAAESAKKKSCKKTCKSGKKSKDQETSRCEIDRDAIDGIWKSKKCMKFKFKCPDYGKKKKPCPKETSSQPKKIESTTCSKKKEKIKCALSDEIEENCPMEENKSENKSPCVEETKESMCQEETSKQDQSPCANDSQQIKQTACDEKAPKPKKPPCAKDSQEIEESTCKAEASKKIKSPCAKDSQEKKEEEASKDKCQKVSKVSEETAVKKEEPQKTSSCKPCSRKKGDSVKTSPSKKSLQKTTPVKCTDASSKEGNKSANKSKDVGDKCLGTPKLDSQLPKSTTPKKNLIDGSKNFFNDVCEAMLGKNAAESTSKKTSSAPDILKKKADCKDPPKKCKTLPQMEKCGKKSTDRPSKKKCPDKVSKRTSCNEKTPETKREKISECTSKSDTKKYLLNKCKFSPACAEYKVHDKCQKKEGSECKGAENLDSTPDQSPLMQCIRKCREMAKSGVKSSKKGKEIKKFVPCEHEEIKSALRNVKKSEDKLNIKSSKASCKPKKEVKHKSFKCNKSKPKPKPKPKCVKDKAAPKEKSTCSSTKEKPENKASKESVCKNIQDKCDFYNKSKSKNECGE